MDTESQKVHRRFPICACIAAILQLFILTLTLLGPGRQTARPDGRELGGVFISFTVLDFIPLAAVALAVASLLRRERFQWLGWLLLFSYGFPMLYALLFAARTATRH
jgi:hypothetical protein